MRVAEQVSIRPHVLQLPAISLAARFRPFAAKILEWAAVDADATARARARAVVGWFAAHAVHPQPFLRPDETTLNAEVLPAGEDWESFNDTFGPTARINSDTAFWYSLFPNGVSMLQSLIGTTDSGGTTTDNGMLTEYEPGMWRIRNFTTFRAVQCTLQCKMAQVVLAAIGIPSFDISTVGHDPMAYYDIETRRWCYIDPTFGEMLKVFSRDQTPLDLLKSGLSEYDQAIQGEKLPGADYIAVGYYTSPGYAEGGMSFMTIHTAPQWAGGLSARTPYRFGNLPSQSSANDLPGSIAQLLPELGVGIAGIERRGETVEVRLRSNWPGHTQFERSANDGGTWSPCSATDYFQRETGSYQYRSVDAEGFAGSPAKIES